MYEHNYVPRMTAMDIQSKQVHAADVLNAFVLAPPLFMQLLKYSPTFVPCLSGFVNPDHASHRKGARGNAAGFSGRTPMEDPHRGNILIDSTDERRRSHHKSRHRHAPHALPPQAASGVTIHPESPAQSTHDLPNRATTT
jgi:hypothetical protein